MSLAVLAYGAIVRPPHCATCAEHTAPRDLLLPGQDYRDPLVSDVLASGIRPCAKAKHLQRLAGAGAPKGARR